MEVIAIFDKLAQLPLVRIKLKHSSVISLLIFLPWSEDGSFFIKHPSYTVFISDLKESGDLFRSNIADCRVMVIDWFTIITAISYHIRVLSWGKDTRENKQILFTSHVAFPKTSRHLKFERITKVRFLEPSIFGHYLFPFNINFSSQTFMVCLIYILLLNTQILQWMLIFSRCIIFLHLFDDVTFINLLNHSFWVVDYSL